MIGKLTRRNFMKTSGIGIAALGMGESIAPADAVVAETPTRPPNIIFVMVDDMRWDQLGLAGHPFAKTPHLDRIGREGIMFTDAFVTTPLCSPSRASFLTGQYPHKHRIINNDRNGLSLISHKLVTFPQLLRRKGYETAFIGKWHMGEDDTRRPGFDLWVSFRGQGLFLDPVVNINGQREQCTGYMTDLLNGWAVDWLKQKHDKPFMMFLSHKAVHRPFLPAKRHESLYANQTFTPPILSEEDVAGKPAMTRDVPPVDIRRVVGASPEPSEPRYGRGEDPESIFLDHLRCLSSVDDGMGMIFDTLEQSGQLDDTLIIFASDNGYLFGEHGEFMNKRVAYDESLRVPLLMRYPKRIKPSTICHELALNVDLAPTLYDLLDITPPIAMHGASLMPLLQDPKTPVREEFLAEHFLEKCSPRYAEWQAVRSKEWKYIHYPDLENMDELYHLKQDPGEVKNVVHSPEHQTQLQKMKEKLLELLRDSEG
jgi:arylsulfatase A-like enzyme